MAQRGQVISLLCLLEIVRKFQAGYFFKIAQILEQVEHAYVFPQYVLPSGAGTGGAIPHRPTVSDAAHLQVIYGSHLRAACAEIGFVSPIATIDRLVTFLADPPCDARAYQRLAEELKGRLTDELRAATFWFVEREKQHLLDGPALFGTQVSEHFPSASFDIEEAGRCLAFGRSTAGVFHLMRVMEVVLGALAKSLKIAPGSPTWDAILTKVDGQVASKGVKKTPAWKKREPFYSGANAHLRNVKNAWRNPTMHVASIHDEERAGDIFTHVRALTRHVAEHLDDTGKWRA